MEFILNVIFITYSIHFLSYDILKTSTLNLNIKFNIYTGNGKSDIISNILKKKKTL